MKIHSIQAVLLLSTITMIGTANSDTHQPSPRQTSDLTSIQSSATDLLRQRSILLDQIETFIRKNIKIPEKQQEVHDALAMLGKLNARESIPLLVQNVTFSGSASKSGGSAPPDLLNMYPSATALIEIGSDALDPLLERVTNTDISDFETYMVASFVFRLVLRSGPAAHSYLQNYQNKTRLTDEQKTRIDRFHTRFSKS